MLAAISAKRYGNWTRFINHSCEAGTRFSVVRVGDRWRSVVRATRDVEVFEEVTVDYGEGYWRGKRCECGSEGCLEKRRGGVGEVGRER